MSSIVKKASQFIPKLKQKPIRKKAEQPSTLTPPNSQLPDNNKNNQTKTTDDKGKDDHAQSQVKGVNFDAPAKSTSSSKSKDTAINSEDVDPIDSSKKLNDSVIHEEGSDDSDGYSDDDEVDNEIFRRPEDSSSYRRNSSIKAQRRLSGITSNLIRRSSSVTSTPPVSTQADGGETGGSAPVKIGIPVSKPTRKRRSSVGSRSSNKKQLKVDSSSITKVSQDKIRENIVDINNKPVQKGRFIIGVDSKTNKLRKFRLQTGGDSDNEDYYEGKNVVPFAPGDLDTEITSATQLPRKIREDDISLYAQIGVNVEEITMADLCKPNLPIGEVSNNYDLVKAAQSKIKKRREDRRRTRLSAREQRISLEKIASEDGIEDNIVKKQENDLLNDDIEDQTPHTKLRLTMKADGSIGYDEDSTVVSRQVRLNSSGKSREESNPFENPITSSAYSKRKHTDRWTPAELKQFYEALSTWGTDFTFIAQLFPYRTRKQIKSKFNLEEKKYPEIIEMALRRKLPADFEKYCRDSKNQIETLEFYNEELRKVRVNHEEHMALIAEEREKAMKEDAEASRKREVEIRTGSKSMTKAEKLKELRKNEMVLGSIDEVKKQRNDIEL